MIKQTQPKLDIFAILSHIDSADTKFLDSVSSDLLKTFSGYVTMLWMRGASSKKEAHIVLTNEFVNQYAFSLSKHPILLYKLLVAANGYGEKTYYKFLKSEKPYNTEHLKALMEKYNYSKREALESLKFFSEDELKEIIESIDGVVKKK